MATIRYKGMDLEEFTSDTPVFWDTPRKAVIWDDPKVTCACKIYAYIPSLPKPALMMIDASGDETLHGRHCALLPEEPEPRKVTNRELAEWLARGNGQVSYFNEAGIGCVSSSWTYLDGDHASPTSEADKVIADLEESHKMEVKQLLMEIVELKDKLQNVSELLKETREWLIESQKMHKRCADGASKQIRRLKRALYKACANWGHFAVAFFSSYTTKEKWHKMERKCLNKMEEYK